MGYEFEELSSQVIEIALHVHKSLGPGFLESIYQNALQVALESSGLVFEAQKEIKVFYREIEVGRHRLDFLVDNEIVVELKAVEHLEDIHFAQVKSYLRATGLHVGLLLNFNAPKLVIKRVVT